MKLLPSHFLSLTNTQTSALQVSVSQKSRYGLKFCCKNLFVVLSGFGLPERCSWQP